jgi:enoyl-CoA hydratase/carnithine racemase
MAVVRAELGPGPARRLTLLGRNVGPEAALAEGVLDELASPETVLARARAVATELAAIPRETYAVVKRQLRADALRLAETPDPAAGAWLTAGTAGVAAALLRSTRA